LTVALLALIALLSWAPAYAQGGTGEIWGQVTETTGEVVDRATVTVTHVDTGANRETRTDGHGRFGFAALPAGRYQVTAVHDGFAGRRQDDIVLLPGHRMQIVLPLRHAPIPETISLNPYPPIAESARTHASAFVAETEIHDLPVAGRRYLRLAELTPAVSPDAATGGVSVMQLPSGQNRLVVDGFDHTSSVTGEPVGREGPGRAPYQFSQATVDAYRVETSAAPAENGRGGAAVFNVVTRSGANVFHGSGYEYFGDRALNGRKTLDEKTGLSKPPYRNNQFGAVLGGPIVKEHNFFLLGYEGLQQTGGTSASPNLGLFSAAGASALARLDAVLPRAARDQHQDLLLARTDHEYARQHLTLRYIDQQFDGQPTDTAAVQPSISSDGLSFLRTRTAGASLASALGSAAVNEAHAQYAGVRDEEHQPSSPVAVVVWQDGSLVAQTGSSLYGPHAFGTRRLQVGDSLSWLTGGHSIKAGGDILRDRNKTRFGGRATAIFQTIGAFAARVPDAVTLTSTTPTVNADVTHYAAFLQDAWRATTALTVDLGVRYDYQDLGGGFARDRNNRAPRVGLAFAPGERRSVWRAAYGVFYGSTPALIPAFARGFPNVVVDSSFETSRVHQASAGWEWEKYRVGSMGIDYLFARGERLPRAIDVNIGGAFAGAGRVVSFQSTGQSLYNGVTFHQRARILQQLFYTVAYTFARSDDTPQQPIATMFGGMNDRRSLAIQGPMLDTRAPGSNDQHQHLTASAMYDTTLFVVDRRGLSKRLLGDWELAVVYTYQTGLPYSAFVDGDLNGDRNPFNDLAPETAWNAYRLPYRSSIDPRVARRFRLGGSRQLAVIWEAFNLMNRPNYTAADNTLYWLNGSSLVSNPLFGRRTAQADGRVMQLAARLTF
jgi:hypothetical protein